MLKKNFFQKSGQLCPKVPQTNQDELSPAHELPKFNRGHSQRKSLKISSEKTQRNSLKKWNFQGYQRIAYGISRGGFSGISRSKVKKWKIPREFSGTAHRW